jgi:hypothetical protein
MDNSQRYHFADFTLGKYKDMVRLASSKWAYVSYSEQAAGSCGVLWRHDVDFWPPLALEMARLEASLGCRSTYFLLPRSEFYNLLEFSHVSAVREMLDLGHEVGLHFDAAHHRPANAAELERALVLDKGILESVTNRPVEVFSYHLPNEFTLSHREPSMGGMINTYSRRFQEDIPYCSDSNGYWRHQPLPDFLAAESAATTQALTHPEWWTEGILSPKQKLEACLERQSGHARAKWMQMLADCGRPLPDWE